MKNKEFETCNECLGTGYRRTHSPDKQCKKCGGTGRARKRVIK